MGELTLTDRKTVQEVADCVTMHRGHTSFYMATSATVVELHLRGATRTSAYIISRIAERQNKKDSNYAGKVATTRLRKCQTPHPSLARAVLEPVDGAIAAFQALNDTRAGLAANVNLCCTQTRPAA